MHVVKEVAGIKKANGIGICDSSREDELIAAIKDMSEDGFLSMTRPSL